MNNHAVLSPDFERQKNLQAALYTAAIVGAILLMVFLIKFYEPVTLIPAQEEYIDINLGSSDVGSGNDQPQLPGEPAPEQQVAYTPAQPVVKASAEPVKDIEESDDREATPVYKPTVTKPQAKKLNEETKVVKTTNTAATATPAPPAPQPRAVMGQVRGGNGNGGNGAETYKPGTGEGQGGGAGDQGSIGGNPNGRDYTPRRLAVRVVSIPAQSFEDDFNEGGTIALDIEVDPNGKLVSAAYQVSGSSLPRSSKQYNIALARARQIQYPKYESGFKQKLSFNFSVK